MTSRQFHLHNGKKGAALAIRITTRARRREITKILEDGTVKIRLTSTPVKGKANQELIEYLAEVLSIPPSRIEIVAGEDGRDKLVSILDLDTDAVHQRILENIS